MCLILNIGVYLFACTLLKTVLTCNCPPPIKIRTLNDIFMWRNIEIYMKEKYLYQKQALRTPITCPEYAYCQSSIMQNKEKEKLLYIFNDIRNSFASNQSNQSGILQLVWLWKAEINATLDSFACAPGTEKFDILKRDDVNMTKPNRMQTVYVRSKSTSSGEPITCYPLQMIFNVKFPNITEFLFDFKNKLIRNATYYKSMTDKFGKSQYIGCNLMFTRNETEEDLTNAYLNCYFCWKNNVSTEELGQVSKCPSGYEPSKEFRNLCKDPQITNSFIFEELSLQYNCLRLNRSHGNKLSGGILLLALCYLCAYVRNICSPLQ